MICELMASGPVSEPELRVVRHFSKISGAKGTESRSSWIRQGRMGTENEGSGHKIWKQTPK